MDDMVILIVRRSCCRRYTECAEGELEAGTTASSTEQSRPIADKWNDMGHGSMHRCRQLDSIYEKTVREVFWCATSQHHIASS